jgi:hypothetical protein
MKRQDVYNTWIETRDKIDIKENFASDVMNRIGLYEQKNSKVRFDCSRFIELISASLSAQAALVAAGAIVGFTRIVIMFAVILGY